MTNRWIASFAVLSLFLLAPLLTGCRHTQPAPAPCPSCGAGVQKPPTSVPVYNNQFVSPAVTYDPTGMAAPPPVAMTGAGMPIAGSPQGFAMPGAP